MEAQPFPVTRPAGGPAPEAHRTSLRLAGRAVAKALRPGASGRVLAVFPRSAYLALDDGTVICLGGPGLGAGPLNGLCWADPRPGALLSPGDPVRLAAGVLHVGSRLCIGVTDARPWQPPPVDGPPLPGALARGLTALVARCRSAQPARGLARLALGSPAPAEDPADRGLLERAAEAAHALQAWLAAPDAADTEPPKVALGLLGLGPGLTPAGDDFLGGLLIALRALGPAPWGAQAADRLAEALEPRLAAGTSRISAAHLHCAALGEGAEPLHAALAALAAGDGPALAAPLARLDAIGHTSGWDALAGVVCAARALCATGTV